MKRRARRTGKGDSANALRRQWLELKFLAEARTGKSVGDVLEHLAGHSLSPSRRTVERDLIDLQGLFPLKCTGNQPQTWFFERSAPRVLVPGLTTHEALSFALVEQQLARLLPGPAQRHLKAHFEAARQVLQAEAGRETASWKERVLVASRVQPLVPAKVADGITETVYDAVLRRRQLAIRYRGRGAEEQDLLLHPLGLAVRDTASYLVATAWEYKDLRLYVLHRIGKATLVEAPARWPKGFDMKAYVEAELGFPMSQGKVPLELRIHQDVVVGFEETPLSADQRLEPDRRPDWWRLRARVADTRVLRAFLLGYGELLEVLGPPVLRSDFRRRAKALAAAYAGR